jgi:hypothetical protein
MIAYVFWHFGKTEIPMREYEPVLAGFHDNLRQNKPDGFLRSKVYRVKNLPWMDPHRIIYEDWYIVENFSALDALNLGAVAPRMKGPHDKIASFSDRGAGGIFRLKNEPEPEYQATVAYWLTKPLDMTYEHFYTKLEPFASHPQAALWTRQLVLGPSKEFCLHAPKELEIPLKKDILTRDLEQVWPQERSL